VTLGPSDPAWLDEHVVLAIHVRLLTLDGGLPGVRDPGLLASALARPRQHHADEGTTDVVRLAALCTESIIRNHPFVDGNKRTGFVVGVLFLELHGRAFMAPQELATVAVLDLAAGRTGLAGYERFLRDYVRPAARGA
jgi:death-on-curing protein